MQRAYQNRHYRTAHLTLDRLQLVPEAESVFRKVPACLRGLVPLVRMAAIAHATCQGNSKHASPLMPANKDLLTSADVNATGDGGGAQAGLRGVLTDETFLTATPLSFGVLLACS